MTTEEKAPAFIEGRYTKGSSGIGLMTVGDMTGDMRDGKPNDQRGGKGGGFQEGDLLNGIPGKLPGNMTGDAEDMFDEDIRNGGPAMGSTASSSGEKDSVNYDTFEEMAADYASDIAEITAGDEYGKNIVSLYNPLNYIGADNTQDPVWTRLVMGAVEGDISMMPSLNLEIAWLNAGVNTVIQWQWDGGHVPSEVLGNTLSLYIDTMFGKHVSGVAAIKPDAVQAANGTAAEPTGTDLSSWVNAEDMSDVRFSLADILAYRNSGATKKVPGFDVIDHGQENYVFGNASQDARHWNVFLNDIFRNEAYAAVLRELFNK